jgi:hypothetical protein
LNVLSVATQAVQLGNRIVLAGTIQAQIFGHHRRGNLAELRGEMIGHRFPAAIARTRHARLSIRRETAERI